MSNNDRDVFEKLVQPPFQYSKPRDRFDSDGSTRKAFFPKKALSHYEGRRVNALPPTNKSSAFRKKSNNVEPFTDPPEYDKKGIHSEGNINEQKSMLFEAQSTRMDLERGVPSSETKRLLQPNDGSRINKYVPSLGESESEVLLSELREQQNDINTFSRYALGLDPDDQKEQLNKLVESARNRSEIYENGFCLFFEDIVRKWFYNHDEPEFTTQQQFVWAVVLGITMGILTAKWTSLVDFLVHLVWNEIPEKLLVWGIFTDLDGQFPLPHYMWICPAIFGGVLSFINAILPRPIPDRDEWIDSLHRKGIMEHETLIPTFFISTAGMVSGLSLGPELPLVMTSGMIGSILAKATRQSILSSRVMNLTATSAAVGGFFGFPMAGALFVLELPHQMGLQYFEALNPSVIASIVAVLVNRMVIPNDGIGYFDYPIFTDILPNHVFYVAILYGLLGGALGMLYAKGCLKIRMSIYDLFRFRDHSEENIVEDKSNSETFSLEYEHGSEDSTHLNEKESIAKSEKKSLVDKISSFSMKNEPLRASLIGIVAGAVVGVICMFYPQNLFWGEAQLQTLIDNGKTPLPIFGRDGKPTADLIAYGYCLSNGENDFQFSVGCSAIFVVTKIIVIGLSLGTGIIGGHFWGPLCVGAAGANLFTGLMTTFSEKLNFGHILSKYPCLAMLCIMGSTHVVTFKANMAIMLVLTLTINSFTPQQNLVMNINGDSGVFPLLVISCFVSLFFTRGTIFYKNQRNRGDLVVTEQTLCEPGKFGNPLSNVKSENTSFSSVGSAMRNTYESFKFEGRVHEFDHQKYESNHLKKSRNIDHDNIAKTNVQTNITQDDIERDFDLRTKVIINSSIGNDDPPSSFTTAQHIYQGPNTSSNINDSTIDFQSVSSSAKKTVRHRRIRSAEVKDIVGFSKLIPSPSLPVRNSHQPPIHTAKARAYSLETDQSKGQGRISTFGEILNKDMQPPLLDQARMRAASKSSDDAGIKSGLPKIPRKHRRSTSMGNYQI